MLHNGSALFACYIHSIQSCTGFKNRAEIVSKRKLLLYKHRANVIKRDLRKYAVSLGKNCPVLIHPY